MGKKKINKRKKKYLLDQRQVHKRINVIRFMLKENGMAADFPSHSYDNSTKKTVISMQVGTIEMQEYEEWFYGSEWKDGRQEKNNGLRTKNEPTFVKVGRVSIYDALNKTKAEIRQEIKVQLMEVILK